MIIEKINILKNNIISVTFSKGEIYFFSRCVFLKAKLKEGLDLSYNLIKKLEYESNLEFAKEYALCMLDKKSCSSKELFSALKKKYDSDIASNTIINLKNMGILDDMAFLKNRAIYFINQKMYGKKRVILEFKRLGFNDEDVEKSVKNLDFKERENIKKIIHKKYKNFFTNEKEKRRAMSALLRYGHSVEEIRSALQECEQ